MSTASVNTHFPGYEILGELGRSNARVLKARHVATGDLVAIKHFTLGTDADTLRRFQQESAIMTSIRHPNVVQVREVQLDMPMPFIVMEWVEGGDLRSLITQQGRLDVPTLIRLGLQMASAFSAIHPQGIIHRDLKPENILHRPLPSGELHFLLTDFGIARLREQTQTMTGQSLMTYEYASPEQFENPRGVTVATDYYSLGVVLYECLTGKVPFSLVDNGSMATFMNQVLRTPPPRLPPDQPIPPSLETLLTWTLTKDPAQRLDDVNELTLLLGQANVEQLQAGRTGGRPVPVSSRLQTMAAPRSAAVPDTYDASMAYVEPTTGSNSTVWGILVGILAVGLMVGGVYYYKTHQPRPTTVTKPDLVSTLADSVGVNEVVTDTMPVLSNPPAEVITTDTTAADPEPAPVISGTVSTPPTTAPDSTSTAAPTDSSRVNE